MIRIKYAILSVCCLMMEITLKGQEPDTLQLETCYRLAEQNYPLIKQRALIAKSKAYTLENISKGNLPQLAIHGQATHQSDVTQIPVDIPGMEVPTVSKDQYRIYGEINQPLTDLITVKHQKEVQEISSSVQEQTLEVELYKLRARINQLFFGALLIGEQLKQNELLKKDIHTGMAKVNAAVTYGTELKSSLDKLKAELLKADQRDTELKAARKAYLEILGLFVNQSLTEATSLKKPENLLITDEIKRPELKLYDLQKQSYNAQDKLINTRNMPKVSLFLQGGFGKPSPVNMLSNDFSSYYIGGLRLGWTLSSFYTSSRERQLLAINQNLLNVQKETFLFNTGVSLRQQSTEVTKLQGLIHSDEQIITLRASIKQASNVQLENGVLTVNDFLREVNAEDQARQNKLLHEMQLLMAQYNYQTTAGN
jgi:hypothetical protein